MESKASRSETLTRMVQAEQARHAAEAMRRLRAARDRLIGAVFWYGVSVFVPADWKWAAWSAAFVMLFMAFWNAEQSWIENRLSNIPLSTRDLAD